MRTKCLHVFIPAVIIALGLAAEIAEAQGPPPDAARQAELLRRFDTNGDGRLSPDEIEAARSAHAVKSSANTGGPLAHPRAGTTEPPPSNNRMIEQLLKRFDLNSNGKLDIAEMDALREFMKSQPQAVSSVDDAKAAPRTGQHTDPHPMSPHTAKNGDNHE